MGGAEGGFFVRAPCSVAVRLVVHVALDCFLLASWESYDRTTDLPLAQAWPVGRHSHACS